MFKKIIRKRQRSSERYRNLYPLTGEYVKIEDIPDPVFAQK